MEDQGMGRIPKALTRGETLVLSDQTMVSITRWSAMKAMQVTKLLSTVLGKLPEAEIVAALEAKSVRQLVQLAVDAAEQNIFAIAELCMTPEDRARVNVREMDWGDFAKFCEAVARVNITGDDLKNLAGLAPWLRKRVAGPSSTPSSQPSGV
jgi:hypothetical protein